MLVGRLYQPQLLQLWRSNCSLERFTAAVFLRRRVSGSWSCMEL